jgi:type IV fimbrial biogenesis protein FimT
MKKRMRGFTLLELMVVVVIAGLLLGIGVPAMGDFIRNARMTAAANDLLAAMHVARSEAIKRKGAATLCTSANPLAADADVACSASRLVNSTNGWIVFVDDNVDGIRNAGEELLIQHGPLTGGVVGRSSISPLRVTYLDTGFSGSFVDVDGDGKRDVVADDPILDSDGNIDGYEDNDGDGDVDVVEPVIRAGAFNFVLCDKRGNKASAGELSAARGISVAVTGRPEITRTPSEITALKASNAGGAIAGCT